MTKADPPATAPAKRGHGFRLFQDLIVLASGQMAGKVIGFISFAYLGHVLDPASYGGLEYVVSLGMFFAMVVDGGLGAIGVRRTAKDPSLLPRLAFQIPLARLLIAVIGIPVMALIATHAMATQVPPALIWLYAFSLLAAPWRQEWLLQASERMTENAIAQVIRAGLYVALAFLLIKGSGDLVKAGWAEIVSVAAMTLFCLGVQHFRVTPFRLKGSFDGFFPMIREGAAISSTNLVWATNQAVPLILIGSLVGGADVGVFGAATRIIGSLLTFSNLYHFNLFPAVTRAHARSRAEMAALLAQSFRAVSWAGVLAALGLTLFAQPIVDFTFGRQLSGAALPLAIMSWGLPIALWSGHSRWGLVATGEQGRVLIAHLIGLAAVVIGCLVLGPIYGVRGYAIGATAGPAAIWLSSHFFAALKGNSPPRFGITVRPLALAGILAWLCFKNDTGLWGGAVALLLYVLLAPLVDRKIVSDLLALGRAKSPPPA